MEFNSDAIALNDGDLEDDAHKTYQYYSQKSIASVTGISHGYKFRFYASIPIFNAA